MHFEILVEDASGALLLDAVLPKILGKNGATHTWRAHSYKGIGRLPKNLRGKTDPSKRVLLDRLPKLLAGYGHSHQHTDSAVIVVVDLDDRNCIEFKRELVHIHQRCHPRPRVLFRIAIEEIEAWLLGDRTAILKEFPRARTHPIDKYVPDSICGTWETLADALYPGGAAALKAGPYPRIGAEKCRWASQIGPHLTVDSNRSPSFSAFVTGIRKLAGQK